MIERVHVMFMPVILVFSLVLLQTPAQAAQKSQAPRGRNAPDALQVQVMLDRAGFSPGALDGRMGANTRKALDAFHKAGRQDDPSVQAVTTYHITAEDVAGPFVTVPSDMMQQSKLPALGYSSALEMLAERFHSVPALLQRLNPQAKFAADEDITVPNVEALVPPAQAPAIAAKKSPEQAKTEAAAAKERAAEKPDVTVTVAKSTSALTVTDAGGRVLYYAPVTTGSQHDPLPLGEWKVRGIQFNPTFRYNPDLFWDAEPSQTKATLAPGPNNPVGLVWIDLSKEHYGLHGTPEPSTIGKTQSHGCVRMTNWDALKVAGMVKPGTRVVFTE